MSTTCQSWLQDLEVEEEEEEEEEDAGLFGHHHPHNLSRLSVCTTSSSTMCGVDEDSIMMSRLSIDDEGEDADGELSGEDLIHLLSSASEKEEDSPCCCSSLPNTPPRRRRKNNKKVFGIVKEIKEKEYASDNGPPREKRRIRNRRSRNRMMRCKSDEDEEGDGSGRGSSSGGVVLITRPKGGKRTLCMGLEEVKACRELGFELELPQTPPYPSLDTSSSGANSPIANWRISSPGDDPREVKARLKVWAQAVALASASKYGT